MFICLHCWGSSRLLSTCGSRTAAALMHCCTAALLHYCTAAALLHCCTAALLHCCTAALLHYCTAALLHCCTTALRLSLLSYTALFYTTLYSHTLHYTALFYTTLPYTALHKPRFCHTQIEKYFTKKSVCIWIFSKQGEGRTGKTTNLRLDWF